jgi:hypothetical protein
LVNNTEIDLGEMGWGGVDWIVLAQDRNQWGALVTMVMNHWVELHKDYLPPKHVMNTLLIVLSDF